MSNDSKIKTFLEKIEKKKSEIGEKPRNSFVTNAIFKFNDNDHLNLNTVMTPEILVRAFSFLLERSRLMEESSKRLGVETEEFKWLGYTVEQWEDDFKTRIAVLNWTTENKKLIDLTKQLNNLISEDGRTELALDEIAKLL